MSENKTGRYLKYAVGEIILVVIGILIALQINNWNQNFKDRSREQLYLRSFKADLSKNLIELDRVIKKSQEVTSTVDSFFLLYKENRSELYDSTFEQLALAGQGFTIFNTQEGTVNDINGSGHLNLIKNDSIRFAIGSWTANLKLIREWEKIEKDSWEKFIGYLNEHVSLYKRRLEKDILTTEEREVLLMDKEFMNALIQRTRVPEILNELYSEESRRTENLIKQIDSVLNDD